IELTLPSADREAEPAAFRDVELANRVAHDNYISTFDGTFSADVDLILSREVTGKFSSDPASDWAGLTNGRLRVHLMEDDGIIMSGEMFHEPYVEALADVIQSIWTSHKEEPAAPNKLNARKNTEPSKCEPVLV
ncbi:MAG: hypothetical protein ACQER4_07575, partial [Bacteroidota bacterium]